jgi:hypothetical protein
VKKNTPLFLSVFFFLIIYIVSGLLSKHFDTWVTVSANVRISVSVEGDKVRMFSVRMLELSVYMIIANAPCVGWD